MTLTRAVGLDHKCHVAYLLRHILQVLPKQSEAGNMTVLPFDSIWAAIACCQAYHTQGAVLMSVVA